MVRLRSLCVFLLLSGPLCARDPLAKVGDFSLPDAQGKKHTPKEWKGSKAIVLIFLGTECPVSNGYAPTLTRLAERYGPRGVLVLGVHPDPDVTAEVARKHAKEYRLSFPTLLDPTQTLARQTGVRIMPEVAVLNPAGEMLYRGRIDDRYALDGKRRDEPRTHDLEDALTAILAGRQPSPRATRAFGCPLPRPIQN